MLLENQLYFQQFHQCKTFQNNQTFGLKAGKDVFLAFVKKGKIKLNFR